MAHGCEFRGLGAAPARGRIRSRIVPPWAAEPSPGRFRGTPLPSRSRASFCEDWPGRARPCPGSPPRPHRGRSPVPKAEMDLPPSRRGEGYRTCDGDTDRDRIVDRDTDEGKEGIHRASAGRVNRCWNPQPGLSCPCGWSGGDRISRPRQQKERERTSRTWDQISRVWGFRTENVSQGSCEPARA